jgi:hypothetical protein
MNVNKVGEILEHELPLYSAENVELHVMISGDVTLQKGKQ